jgi:hypothetical protein
MNFRQITGSAETAKEMNRTLYWQLQPDNNWKVVAKY